MSYFFSRWTFVQSLLSISVVTLVSLPAQAACPEVSLGETAEDCPWAEATRKMISVHEVKPEESLFNHVPTQVQNELHADAGQDGYKSLWGQSINFDELAKDTVVQPYIIDMILSEAGAPARQDRLVHAGIEHTYGYLFSVLKTSFGYKRARWVRDDIEFGFGLPRGTLGPTPSEGTLFKNVTYFAGSIGLRDQAGALSRLRASTGDVAAALRDFAYHELQVGRLEETLTLPIQGRPARKVVLRTDLVAFKHVEPSRPNSYLLIYSVLDSSKTGPARLITAFPVDAAFAKRAFDPDQLGSDKPISTRYNAFVEGVTGANPSLTGTRKVVSPLD